MVCDMARENLDMVQFQYYSMVWIFKTAPDLQPTTHSITDLTTVFCYSLACAYIPHWNKNPYSKEIMYWQLHQVFRTDNNRCFLDIKWSVWKFNRLKVLLYKAGACNLLERQIKFANTN